jgi:uncharacterized protein
VLISFKVSNYKSLRDEQELSMLPSKRGGDFKALPVVAIYGANAAGKSNLIEALKVLGAGDDPLGWVAPQRWELHNPFLLDAMSHLDRPTVYVIEVEIKGVRYVYEVAASNLQIERERLHAYPHGRPRMLLDRAGGKTEFGDSVSNRKALAMLAEEVPESALVLHLAQTYRAEEFQPFRNWMLLEFGGLRGHHPERPLPGPRLNDPLVTALERYPVLNDFAQRADLGISRIDVSEDPGAESGFWTYLDEVALRRNRVGRKDMKTLQETMPTFKKLDFYHVGCLSPFGLGDESEGTITFLRYMARILEALDRADTLVVDEFDTSLHPRLIPRIIELFKDKRTNPKNAQLIFTTHDVTLMGTSFGEPILARDEIWFVEKGEDGASELYPLTAYKPRKEHNLERQYLGGSYGAVPEVYPESLVEVLVEHQERAA